MLLRLLRETLWRRRQRVAIAVLAVVIGSSLATALFAIYADIMDKMGRELRSYGANILVTPRSQALDISIAGVSYAPAGEPTYIPESSLPRLKTIFWRNNVLGFAPFLTVVARAGPGKEPVAVTGTWFDREVRIPKGTQIRATFEKPTSAASDISFRTGVRQISPWWRLVEGQWPRDDDSQGALVGQALARRVELQVGDRLALEHGSHNVSLAVSGILSTGGPEDDQVIVPLPVAQGLAGAPGGVGRVLVSALTLPKEKLSPDIRNKRPEDMTPKEYEKWYCSPIIEAVVTQIKEALPGSEARAIRQIAEAEGAFLTKVQWMILLIALVAVAASALAVMAAMTASVLERRGEIGLIKALGAQDSQVAAIFLSEAGAIGLVGGLLGYGLGTALAAFLGERVFGAAISPSPPLVLFSLVLALGVALAGSALPVRQATRVEPITLLRGG